MRGRLHYYRLAYRWARSMGFAPSRALELAREGWRKQIAVPIPDVPPPEAFELGRRLARKYDW